jgi:hypothetical protein
MIMKIFFSILLLLTGVLCCRAQVPVSQEPMHHVVFQNSWVRVLDVHIPPGDTSLMHKHEIPSVFLVLSKTKTGTETVVEPTKMVLTAGNIWFEGFYTSPRIHRVWNSDTTEFHVIDMELMSKIHQPIDNKLEQKQLTLLFDENPVRGYRVALASHATIRIPARKAPIVLVGLSQALGYVTVNTKTFEKKGDFAFVPAGTAITIESTSGSGQELALFELK